MRFYKHQEEVLLQTAAQNHVAYFLDMGLGKTYVGAEKMVQLGNKVNLVICQKSKIDDWVEHFINHYEDKVLIFDLTDKTELESFMSYQDQEEPYERVGVINYELAWRRKELLKLQQFTLMLDESSLIQNENSKRSKFILKLQAKNVILLSGTPCNGEYKNLWSQLHLLGWPISKKMFYNHYLDYHWDDSSGFPRMVVDGYKNVERLKRKMRMHGCCFLKTEECIDLPEKIDQVVKVPVSKEYRTFKKDRICTVKQIVQISTDGLDGPQVELVGDTTLTKLLYERQLCGQFNLEKLEAFRDLVESTNDRLIVFYNFTSELYAMQDILLAEDFEEYSKRFSVVNGSEKHLLNYENKDNSITFIQYQAGAFGLNLQKANKIIYFTPPLSSEMYEQSKKRINRIGQDKTCFYYQLICKGSVEEKIYRTLAMRRDYTEALFEEGE